MRDRLRAVLPLCACLAFFGFTGAHGALAQEAAATPEPSKASEVTRQTLLYGIDSQVLDVVKKLRASGDTSFTAELVAILRDNRPASVLGPVFELFGETGIKEGEDRAKGILQGWQESNGDLVIAALRYLAAISAGGTSALMIPLLDASDATLVSAAIRSLGKSGDTSGVGEILFRLANPDYRDSFKPDLILALGDLGDPRAVDDLLRIAGSPEEEKVRRMYAADSLGKIKDPRALPVLKGLFDENDALVRSYAASALSRFELAEVFPVLLRGLKDENWKVRVECAKGLARSLTPDQESAAVPVLSFKADLDPTGQVRLEAIRALGEIGGATALGFLEQRYADPQANPEVREACIQSLLSKDLPRAAGAVMTVLNAEWKSTNQRTVESTARLISTMKGTELRDAFVKLLDSTNAVVRSYGVRGIALNKLSDLKERLAEISRKDPHPAVRKEAEKALAAMP